MNALLVGTTLLLTILAALGLGIVVGYYAIIAVLQLLAHRQTSEPSATPLVHGHPAHGD